jgi:hypothetical protein
VRRQLVDPLHVVKDQQCRLVECLVPAPGIGHRLPAVQMAEQAGRPAGLGSHTIADHDPASGLGGVHAGPAQQRGPPKTGPPFDQQGARPAGQHAGNQVAHHCQLGIAFQQRIARVRVLLTVHALPP